MTSPKKSEICVLNAVKITSSPKKSFFFANQEHVRFGIHVVAGARFDFLPKNQTNSFKRGQEHVFESMVWCTFFWFSEQTLFFFRS